LQAVAFLGPAAFFALAIKLAGGGANADNEFLSVGRLSQAFTNGFAPFVPQSCPYRTRAPVSEAQEVDFSSDSADELHSPIQTILWHARGKSAR